MDATEAIPIEELNEVGDGAGSGHLFEALGVGHVQHLLGWFHRVVFQISRAVRNIHGAARHGLVQPAGLQEKLLARLLEQILTAEVQESIVKCHVRR